MHIKTIYFIESSKKSGDFGLKIMYHVCIQEVRNGISNGMQELYFLEFKDVFIQIRVSMTINDASIRGLFSPPPTS